MVTRASCSTDSAPISYCLSAFFHRAYQLLFFPSAIVFRRRLSLPGVWHGMHTVVYDYTVYGTKPNTYTPYSIIIGLFYQTTQTVIEHTVYKAARSVVIGTESRTRDPLQNMKVEVRS